MTCNKCNIDKDEKEFSVLMNGKLRLSCKDCMRKQNNKRNREKRLKLEREYYKIIFEVLSKADKKYIDAL